MPGLREDGLLSNAGIYRLMETTLTIPAEPDCPAFIEGGFEPSPEWVRFRDDLRNRTSDPELWTAARLLLEKTIGLPVGSGS